MDDNLNLTQACSNEQSISMALAQERANQLEASIKTKESDTLPLHKEIPPPKPFPFDALGSKLALASKRIHEIVKAPDAICGQSALAVAALITQPFADIHIDGRVYPLSLFMLTAAESGDRKSAVDSIVLKPVRDYEKMLAKTYDEEMRAYRNKFDIWKKERDLTLKDNSGINLEKRLNALNPEPRPPLKPHIILEEPSYEGLVKLFEVGQPSVGLFSDEGGRMLGGYAMGKDNLLKTASGLSSLWDGKPITRIRGGDNNLLLFGKRFSTHLMMQETVLASLLKNEALVGQGFLARCLIVSPLSTAGERPYNPIDISQEESIRNFWNHVSYILDQAFPLTSEDTKNELSPRLLELDRAAKATWIRFHDEIDQQLKTDGLYYPIRRTANKAAEQVLRIAGVLALFENFETHCIEVELLERSITLMRFYLEEALRITEIGYLNPDLELAEKVFNWMKKKVASGNTQTFTLSKIYQSAGPRQVRDKKTAEKIMKILEDHKKITAIERSEWRINT